MAKKIGIGIAIAVVVGLLLYFLWPSKKEVTFKTQVIEEGSISKSVSATGYLQPADKVEVGTQVSGKVEKLYVTYNSKVKKGQVLAELDKSTLLERLSQAKSQKSSAESTLNLATQNYNRTKALFEAGAATQQSYDEATNTYIQAQNTLNNANTNVREAQVNLGYAVITSPIDGVILAKQVEQGQTVASSFSTPTLFVIAKDLKSMTVEANIDEADIGQVKVGQKVEFTVDSYMGETFNGEVKEIRLEPKVTSNVVTYTVVVKAENPEEKLFPGMTASVTIFTDLQQGKLVPVAAMAFNPSEEVLASLDKPERPSKDGMREGREGRHSEGVDGEKGERPSREKREAMRQNGQKVWIKNGNSIRPRFIETGVNDGVNAIVKEGLAVGDTVVISAQVGEKVKKAKGGPSNNPLAPQPPRGSRKMMK
ncbi:MAG: efflux RND transporter periplasmic adaptor subunit [Bacteroidales bacterium]|nr:efflux RND transporter periplasmic adaptor subunit [Candidatus Scybalocola fimicaballi]